MQPSYYPKKGKDWRSLSCNSWRLLLLLLLLLDYLQFTHAKHANNLVSNHHGWRWMVMQMQMQMSYCQPTLNWNDENWWRKQTNEITQQPTSEFIHFAHFHSNLDKYSKRWPLSHLCSFSSAQIKPGYCLLCDANSHTHKLVSARLNHPSSSWSWSPNKRLIIIIIVSIIGNNFIVFHCKASACLCKLGSMIGLDIGFCMQASYLRKLSARFHEIKLT